MKDFIVKAVSTVLALAAIIGIKALDLSMWLTVPAVFVICILLLFALAGAFEKRQKPAAEEQTSAAEAEEQTT
jgi:TRAP-type C4-dicarboxylate transport system permease small subunit